MQIVVLVAGLMLSVLSSRAAVLLEDSFSYPDGPIVGAPGSPFVSSGGTGTADVSGHRLQVTFARGEDIFANLAGQPYSSTGGTNLYARFKVTFTALPTASGGYFAHFKDSGTGFRCRLWTSTANAAAGTFRLAIGNASNTTNTALENDLLLNTTYTVVVRYIVGTGSSTLWLNPASDSDPNVTASDSVTSTPAMVSFAFRQASGIGTVMIDDLAVATSFHEVLEAAPATPPSVITEPQDVTITEGDSAFFTVAVTGSNPLAYQWQRAGASIPDATAASLLLTNVTLSQTGGYSVVITNQFGSATSRTALITVNKSVPFQPAALSLVNYNVKGNGATNWSTNSLQVQALGRQMMYLNPDVITFQEIPLDHSSEMTNFVKAFLPGYNLAMNSGTDGFIRSAILSRYPITRSAKWLDGADLRPFGYTNENGNLDNFSRDLFEAQVAVPHFSQPFHVFTTHLKSGGLSNDVAKRAAEAAAISNFFVSSFLPANAGRPYVLTGDMNESNTNALSIQTLLSAPTGLHLTNPRNPLSGSFNTFSTTSANPSSRLDYIMPGGLLFSNINNSQVFRTDRLNPVPPSLFSNDCKVASDHLPVVMVFNNPFEGAFKVTSLLLTNGGLTLSWQSSTGRQYSVETSTNLADWTVIAASVVANTTNTTLSTNVSGSGGFYRVKRF